MTHDSHEGRRVSRRRIITGIGSIGFGAILTACSNQAGTSTAVATSEGATATITPQSPAAGTDLAALFEKASVCRLTETTTQGPYYFDADKVRGDIREDRQGVVLKIAIKVQDSEKCTPIPDAVVEIWHCDAAGLYSGAESLSQGSGGGGGEWPTGPPPSGGPGEGGRPPQGGQGNGESMDLEPTDDKRYLRGAQVTDASGIVQFTTVWPGWYRGRTVHIHAMVHVDNKRTLTTQVMFPEDLNSEVFAKQPYAARTGRDTFNDGDNIYDDSMLVTVVPDGDGYQAVAVFGADPDGDGR